MQQIAEELLALINSKPQSPSVGEIEDLLLVAFAPQHHRGQVRALIASQRVFEETCGPVEMREVFIPSEEWQSFGPPITKLEMARQIAFLAVGDKVVNPPRLVADMSDPGVPLAPAVNVEEIAPDDFMTKLGDQHLEATRGWEFADKDVSIFWAHPFVLVKHRVENRGVNGMLMNPPRLYARWHCEKNAEIRMDQIPDWDLVKSVAPQQYAALCSALNKRRRADYANDPTLAYLREAMANRDGTE